MATHSQTLSTLVDGILRGGIRVVDLTVPLESATPTIQLPPPFAPSKPFSLEEISHYDERGPAWYWNNIACGEHTGTHFDAPIHWISGRDLPNNATDTIPVQHLIGAACVIDCSAEARADADFLLTTHRATDPSVPDIMQIKNTANRAADESVTARFTSASGCTSA